LYLLLIPSLDAGPHARTNSNSNITLIFFILFIAIEQLTATLIMDYLPASKVGYMALYVAHPYHLI
ncbi:hypothetical protein, partial [Chitinophaga oryziterrae]|uniref:hypothetical protein n=1 Tax=Chitinophaga oryziterrae TaxID=1031224 RepID=UPI0031DF432B